MPAVYQDRKTGKRVVQVGGALGDKEESCLVKDSTGAVFYASKSQLMPCDDEGKPDFSATFERSDEPEEKIPDPVIPVVETRLNINMATAEDIARRVPGIGYRTAKRIKAQQLTMPGEVFRTLDQVRAVSNRVNWDEVLQANQLYLG